MTSAPLPAGYAPSVSGAELYEQEFAFQIQSGETAEALYQRAQQEKERLLSAWGCWRSSFGRSISQTKHRPVIGRSSPPE